MSLLWIDGFDDLATGTGTDVKARLARRYALSGSSNPTYKSRSGRIGGYGLTSDSGTAYMTLTSLVNTNDTLIAGMGIYPRVQSTSTVNFFSFNDGSVSGINCRIECISGEVSAYRGSTFLGGSAGAQVTYGRWYYVEAKVKVHSSAGSVEIRVGGRTVLLLTGINTQAGSHAYYDKFWLHPHSYDYDDIYLADTQGAVNNNFLGNMRVVTLFPNGDGGTNEWTTSSGSDHYAIVDEGIENDDTDYVESDTSGQTELWTYGDISGVGVISGLQLTTVCRDTNTPVFSLKMPAKSGATTSDGTAQVVGMADYGVLHRVLETDPDTTALWTDSGLNAAQFGLKVG